LRKAPHTLVEHDAEHRVEHGRLPGSIRKKTEQGALLEPDNAAKDDGNVAASCAVMDTKCEASNNAAGKPKDQNTADRDQELDAEVQRLKDEARESQELAVKLAEVVGMMGRVLKHWDWGEHEGISAAAARDAMFGDSVQGP
jgi:hypothetical protein